MTAAFNTRHSVSSSAVSLGAGKRRVVGQRIYGRTKRRLRRGPFFKGHNQPQLPSDLGFYDLRLPEARQAQADLAREYGIHGFCYYHYWPNGCRLLERPVNDILASSQPDFPFSRCWANENWTRRWDGQDQEILMGQNHSDEDDLNHPLVGGSIPGICAYIQDAGPSAVHGISPVLAAAIRPHAWWSFGETSPGDWAWRNFHLHCGNALED